MMYGTKFCQIRDTFPFQHRDSPNSGLATKVTWSQNDRIVGSGEPANGVPELARGGEVAVPDHSGGQDTEPDFNLIEPAGIGRRVVEVHMGMTSQPGPSFLLVGRHII